MVTSAASSLATALVAKSEASTAIRLLTGLLVMMPDFGIKTVALAHVGSASASNRVEICFIKIPIGVYLCKNVACKVLSKNRNVQIKFVI